MIFHMDEPQMFFTGRDEHYSHREGTLSMSREAAAAWIGQRWLDGWVELNVRTDNMRCIDCGTLIDSVDQRDVTLLHYGRPLCKACLDTIIEAEGGRRWGADGFAIRGRPRKRT